MGEAAKAATEWERAIAEGLRYPGLEEHRAIEFLAATDDGSAIDGWHWLIEWTTTSFYIKSMNPAIQGAKVSIHGPDAQHPGREHFRFDVERTNPDRAARATRAGGRWLTDTSDLPYLFTGRGVSEHVDHIVRFSAGHDAFVAGAPPAHGSDWPKEKATMRGLLPIPGEGRVIHVDVFVSYDGDPYWPNTEAIRAQRAGLGFMTNSLGWKLSVVVFDRPTGSEPDPCGDFRSEFSVDRCFRGIAATVDDTGLLWLCEKLFPFDEVEEPRPDC
ncbi:hypothetical protein [Mycobacterium ahvazicum]|nr:hypothetical protein [Mycobacterium ahvazicum]